MKNIVLIILFLSSSLLAEIVVIVNPSSGVESLSESDVKRIFMAKTKKFPNGNKVIPIDQNAERETYIKFYEKIAGKSPGKMNRYWVKLIFTGKAEAPEQVGADGDVIGLVSGNKRMIGYIDSEAVRDGVKVVYIVR